MAPRGPKPQPPGLHVVRGTHRTDRHGAAAEAEVVEAREERLEPHKKLRRKRQRELWDEFIAYNPLLGEADRTTAYNWVILQEEFETDPKNFPTSRINALRGLAASLYLDPVSRVRVDLAKKTGKGDPNGKYFA